MRRRLNSAGSVGADKVPVISVWVSVSGFLMRSFHASRVGEIMEKWSVQNFFVRNPDLSKALIVRQTSAAFRSLRWTQETRSTPNRSRLAARRRSSRTPPRSARFRRQDQWPRRSGPSPSCSRASPACVAACPLPRRRSDPERRCSRQARDGIPRSSASRRPQTIPAHGRGSGSGARAGRIATV